MQQVKPYEPIFWHVKYTLVMRVAALIIMSCVCVTATVIETANRFVYLTAQAEILMIIYTATAICHQVLNNDEDRLISKFKGIITHVTLSIHFLVMIFYWIGLAQGDWNRIMNMPKEHRVPEFYNSIFQHSLYCMYVWFNLATERTTLKYSNIFYLSTYVAVYLYQNYWISQSWGRPVYPPIDWKSTGSHIHVGVALFLVFAGFFLSTSLSKAISQRVASLKSSDSH